MDAVKHGVSRRRRRTTASCITRRWLRTMICSRSSQSRQRRQRLTVGRLSKRPPPRAPRRVTGPARTQQQRMSDPRLPLRGGSGLGAPLSGTLSALPLVLPCLSRSGGNTRAPDVAAVPPAQSWRPRRRQARSTSRGRVPLRGRPVPPQPRLRTEWGGLPRIPPSRRFARSAARLMRAGGFAADAAARGAAANHCRRVCTARRWRWKRSGRTREQQIRSPPTLARLPLLREV